MAGLRKRKQIVYARSKLDCVNLTDIRRVFDILRARVARKRCDHPELAEMHDHSFRNRDEVIASAVCGCFACLKTFPSADIGEWWDLDSTGLSRGSELTGPGVGMTAVCPCCGLDAVLGDQCGRELTSEFLAQMQQMWFGEPALIRLQSRAK